MVQYQEILQEILEKGTWKEESRPGLGRTLSRFGIFKRWDLQDGFPMVTTKKIPFRWIIEELLWFLSGSTDLVELKKKGVNIWDQDGYRWYKKKFPKSDLSFEDFQEELGKQFPTFDMGRIYSHQWRSFGSEGTPFPLYEGIDQIKMIIQRIIESPEDRYKVVTAWNPQEISDCALPPCHMFFQMNCREMSYLQRSDWVWKNRNEHYRHKGPLLEKEWVSWFDKIGVPKYFLDCQFYMRSWDVFLGGPFNIASYAALTHIIANITNCIPGELTVIAGDAHFYEEHIPVVKEQLQKVPYSLPQLEITRKLTNVDDLSSKDFILRNYVHHPELKGKLKTGLF